MTETPLALPLTSAELAMPLTSEERFLVDANGRTIACAQDHATAQALADAVNGRAGLEADALRYRYLLGHCSYHYPMDQHSPAEWGISWTFQQQRPDERHGTFDQWIDQDIAHQNAADEEDTAALPHNPTGGL